ncbi:MAG: SDR family NAD(P)-dependent oxidoreductase, partial [Bdellovibrionales bacterium]|nr:SDR family NAD(P)-dependent oxidoreductase [Bdellovibrionales bacterium]
MNSLHTLRDKVAVVTGAGRGIGASLSAEFARWGADVAVNDLNAQGAAETARLVSEQGRKSFVNTGDVSDRAQARDFVASVTKALGRVDILVNNAGITRDALLHKMTEAQWDDVIRVNLKGPFN